MKTVLKSWYLGNNVGSSYSSEYQAILDKATSLGYTKPNATLSEHQNTFISSLVTSSILSELDAFYVFINNDATLGQFSLINWANPNTYLANAVGSPTYGSNGYDFNGSSQYINTTFIPTGGVNYTRDSASFFQYIFDDLAEGSVSVGDSNSASPTLTNSTVLNPRNPSDQSVYLINDGTATTLAAVGRSIHLYHVQRRSSTDKRIFIDGIQVGTASVASTGRSGASIYLSALNYNGTAGAFSSRGIGVFGIGASLSGLESTLNTAFNTYKSDIGL